ncbi:MAG: hypothetical protein AAGJ37_02090 [Pseudomonadota bacterium]
MKAEAIVKIIILMLVVVSTTNSFAFACSAPFVEDDEIMHDERLTQSLSDMDCHSSIPEKLSSQPHCSSVCFCDQAAHSPNIVVADNAELTSGLFHALRFASVQTLHFSINLKPPTPPPTLFHIV